MIKWIEVRKWILRYVRFNLIGTSVFCVATFVYWWTFPQFQAWTWIVANSFGGILQFSLTTYFNQKKKGEMFEGTK
jgi:hypothetical protein